MIKFAYIIVHLIKEFALPGFTFAIIYAWIGRDNGKIGKCSHSLSTQWVHGVIWQPLFPFCSLPWFLGWGYLDLGRGGSEEGVGEGGYEPKIGQMDLAPYCRYWIVDRNTISRAVCLQVGS